MIRSDIDRCVIVLFLSFLFFGCGQIAKETLAWYEASATEEVEGKYNRLENDGIKLFLPSSFKRYSSVEYEKLLKSKLTEDEVNFEMQRIRQMREMAGDVYIFFDDLSYTTCIVNTVPYSPFNKQDAKFLLGMISANQDKLYPTTKRRYNKITAKFNSVDDTQIFKAVYEVSGPEYELPIFSNVYVMSSNQKTAFINYTSVYSNSFDPYVVKTIF